jgi:hypothetical protein
VKFSGIPIRSTSDEKPQLVKRAGLCQAPNGEREDGWPHGRIENIAALTDSESGKTADGEEGEGGRGNNAKPTYSITEEAAKGNGGGPGFKKNRGKKISLSPLLLYLPLTGAASLLPARRHLGLLIRV